MKNTIRLIAGLYRGRRLHFPDAVGLRPTPDRVRETLFNWLRQEIVGACALDLFAGSGAIGFECASRGAARVVMVEQERAVAQALRQSAEQLKTTQVQIHQMTAQSFLQQTEEMFTLAFLDPPYTSSLLSEVIPLLSSRLSVHAYVYVETARGQRLPELPLSWTLTKEHAAGQVCYRLFKVMETQ